MRLCVQFMKLLFNKFVLRKSKGEVLKYFAEEMGIVYIKLAQILATQNYGKIFTLEDREMLAGICDECNPIAYEKVEEVLKEEFGPNLYNIFTFIDKTPVGSASVSQVHRAILKSGEEVAIKIKRRDITATMDNDIKWIRRLVHWFGWTIGFNNISGGDYALDRYLEWISQEVDFAHEMENIKTYQRFADEVNGKVKGTKTVKVPKLYEEYSSNNIIVMEYIETPTINQMELTTENKRIITEALNSYIKASFWALLEGKEVVFHGDPHNGNVCVDESGNVTFLDMGLLFSLNDDEARLCREFFLTAYAKDYEKLYDMLVVYGDMSEKQKMRFKDDCRRYTESLKGKDVTFYFVSMIDILFDYKLTPPRFLFGMAKAFICLNGISKFIDNDFSAEELLQGQVLEFLVRRELKDCKNVFSSGIKFLPKALKKLYREGVASAVADIAGSDLERDLSKAIGNLKEMRNLIKAFLEEEVPTLPNEDSQDVNVHRIKPKN